MFQTQRNQSSLSVTVKLAELIFVSSVRKVRQSHGNALMAIGINLLQSIVFILAFYFMFTIMGTRGMAIRGDFMLYLVSGIFLYLTNIKGLGAVLGAEGPTSSMMQHAPMNTIVAIASSALSALYLQTLSLMVILFGIHTMYNPVVIDNWAGAFLMFLLSWFSGCCIGLVLLALKPWMPDLVQIIQTIYNRANMIASGKMFVANALPAFMVSMFDWNPLFHLIDQARGFVFINYNPHNSNWEYPIYFSLALLMIGLMGEFYTRHHASSSWGAGR